MPLLPTVMSATLPSSFPIEFSLIQTLHLNLVIRDGRLSMHLSDQEEEGEWEGDNPEKEPFI
jgi:hypothetical protein